MPFNLLLLPLLGGYVFLHTAYYFRYRAVAYSSYRLIFSSAVAGVLFGAASYAATRFVLFNSLCPGGALAVFKKYFPYDGGGAAIGALLLAYLFARLLNMFWGREKCAEKVVKKYGSALLMLLYFAQKSKSAVMVTLNTGKVYIGTVTISDNLAPTHLTILPTLSGYRHPETLEVKYTSTYERIYAAIRLKEEGFSTTRPEDFQVVIPLEAITQATPFRSHVHQKHFRLRAGTPAGHVRKFTNAT